MESYFVLLVGPSRTSFYSFRFLPRQQCDMVNRRISRDLKECALSLWDRGWEIEAIMDALLISRSSIYRWKAIFKEHGSVNRPRFAPHGPTRRLTRAVLTAVHTIYEQDSDLYLDELVLWLAINHDIIISVSALHDNLKQSGLTRKVLHKIALERDEELRAQWREVQQDPRLSGDGSEFICLDETSKNEHSYARRYGLAPAGQRAELKDVFVRGDRYSLLAAMTIDGYLATRVVPGSFDSLEFYDFIQEEVVCFHIAYGSLHLTQSSPASRNATFPCRTIYPGARQLPNTS